MVLLAPALLPIGWEFILHAIPPLLVPTRNTYQRFFYWLLNDLALADPRMLEKYVNLMVTSRQCLETAKYAQPSPLKDAELQRIQVPTLLVVGENDRSFSVKKAVRKLNQVAPHWHTEIIPDVGHSLPLVLADVVSQKILEFMAKS
jgi:pimeloyl-ACP methyl ester carboxylesterase